MARPILLAVDDDVSVLEAVVQDLRRQYGAVYRVMRAASGQAALDTLAQLKARQEPVALLLSDQRMPGMTGVDFLERSRELYPDARRVLLTAYADTEAAIRAINAARIHYYLNKPWDPPEEKLYPVLTDLLEDWKAGYQAPFEGLRVGYFPAWMKENPATDVDRAALDVVQKLGMVPVEVTLPDWPYDSLDLILFAEGAAAFEELTLSGALHQLNVQVPDAWPNLFRQSRFLSAVDFVQSDRFRRKVAEEMARVFSRVDLLLVPSLRDEMLTLTNFTGHPSLTLRAGFVEVSEARSDWAPDPNHPLPKFSPPRRVPHGITLIGQLFDEGTLGRVGIALERSFGVAGERPPGF